MAVLDKHAVKDDPAASTDWTAIGVRILEAATMATAIHLNELADAERGREATNGREPASGWRQVEPREI